MLPTFIRHQIHLASTKGAFISEEVKGSGGNWSDFPTSSVLLSWSGFCSKLTPIIFFYWSGRGEGCESFYKNQFLYTFSILFKLIKIHPMPILSSSSLILWQMNTKSTKNDIFSTTLGEVHFPPTSPLPSTSPEINPP